MRYPSVRIALGDIAARIGRRAMDAWWRGGVIYQIYPRSFQDSDGDGIGDLPGIIGGSIMWRASAPMPSGSRRCSARRWPTWATTCRITPTSIRCSARLDDFDAMVARAHGLGLKVIVDLVLSHSSDRHPWFVESRSSRDNPRADWYVWTDPGPDGMPPNNWVSVFGGPAWEWDSRRRQYYLHNFLAAQPDLNFQNPDVQEALLEVMRFWLERGVDGFRLDTVNYYFHDRKLRPNPPARRDDPRPAVNPYDMQDHRFQKNRPENIAFLKRMRALTDGYDERVLIGEVGETPRRATEIMAEYTRGSERLHMAYSFDMLGPEFSARHFRSRIEKYFKAAPDGWPCWSFSNHDVTRHVTRWESHAVEGDALARQAAAMLLSFPGSAGLYQGEELGLGGDGTRIRGADRPAGDPFLAGVQGPRRVPDTDALDQRKTRGLHEGDPLAAGQGAAGGPKRRGRGARRRVGPRVLSRDAGVAVQPAGPAHGQRALLPDGRAGAGVPAHGAGWNDRLRLQSLGLRRQDQAARPGNRRRRAGQDARIEGRALHLGPNGFAFLTPTGRAGAGRIVFKG